MIIAQMVGKNESKRFLKKVLEHLSQQVDKIVFTDDCSDDNTAEIASEYCEVFQNEKSMFEEHEGMLRATAWGNLEKIAKIGDWILAIDCDEMLYHVDDKPLSEVLKASPNDVVSVKFYHMWNQKQYRVDKLWAPNYSSRIFRFKENGGFYNKKLACGSEPSYVSDWIKQRNFWINSGLVMKHLGYMRDKDKKVKYERYSTIDGGQFHNINHINSILDSNPVLIDWGNFGI